MKHNSINPAHRKTVYGKLAYEGFARAMASQMGLTVEIDDGASACINASGKITLPGMNTYQTAEEFAVTCGTLIHEMSHQFYRSHSLIDPNRAALEHACLNAVLDVADETWIDKYFAVGGNVRPGNLLTLGNQWAVREHRSRYVDWSDTSNHAWKVLCVGIFAARLSRTNFARVVRWMRSVTVSHCQTHGVDANAAFGLLRRARITASQNPQPTYRRFGKLRLLARKLADVLAPFAPPAGTRMAAVGISISEALATGESAVPANATVATEAQGEAAAAPVAGQPQACGKPTRGGRGSGHSAGGRQFDQQAFNLLAPAVQRIADRIATDGDGVVKADGLTTGASLGQPHRLMTDGGCMARFDAGEHADGVSVAVILDCSDSMRDTLDTCAGIARAFAVGMRQAGDVQSIVFGDDVQSSDDFRTVRCMGSTGTDLAIAAAHRWLSGRAGDKWIVLITDGMPNTLQATHAAARGALAAGVKMLTVGLNCTIAMPAGVNVVTAKDANRLAIELDFAAHTIERAA